MLDLDNIIVKSPNKLIDKDKKWRYYMNMRSCKYCPSLSLGSEQVVKLATLLKIVAEESRLKILCILREGEHCVCEIREKTDLSQSLISHHLRDLKGAEIVTDKKNGLYVYYSLTPKGKVITNLIFKIKT